MRKPVRIRVETESVKDVLAEIRFEENPRTAETVVKALPIEGVVERWGDEVYFYVSLRLGKENARERVKVGEVAYWPEGPALCIFFGPTPVSPSPDDIRAYSPVNVIGRLLTDPPALRKVKPGEKIRVTLLTG